MDNQTKQLCAQWWADRLEITEKREEFKNALVPKIYEGANLWVDYDPEGALLETLDEIGINLVGSFTAQGIFPAETGMNIYDGVVEVKEGYGGDFVILCRYDKSC